MKERTNKLLLGLDLAGPDKSGSVLDRVHCKAADWSRAGKTRVFTRGIEQCRGMQDRM